MIKFILNNQTIETDLPRGMTVLDFVRYRKNLKGTKIGCREGDCGACTILVGELNGDFVKYRSQTSCLMPLANAAGKHIVTVEGINKPDGELSEVQQSLVDESGTQCGFCTVGFVMSLTGFCIDETEKSSESAISSIDGNICRCTGYKSIERAALRLCDTKTPRCSNTDNLNLAIEKGVVPNYFSDIKNRLVELTEINPKSQIPNPKSFFVGGGTDLYVQRPEEMVQASSAQNLFKHLKLVSSTPIRNMATLGGNFVNASPIGDMTAWFLALDASIIFNNYRELPLKDFYLGYKTLARSDDEFIKKIRFHRDVQYFNFEKVSKRTFLDIASVNTAISLKTENDKINKAHVSAGGVAPIPLYLRKTSEFLQGREISEETILQANEILQSEISPISDVRGSAEYKRLLLRQLFAAHFMELFGLEFQLVN
jgi:xanthine dehydrogenase small subunit